MEFHTVGVYLADYLKGFIWHLALGCILLVIKPVIKVFRE
jgi:hypothetical protein